MRECIESPWLPIRNSFKVRRLLVGIDEALLPMLWVSAAKFALRLADFSICRKRPQRYAAVASQRKESA